MLIMLPKLALVVMQMYLSVLAKVRAAVLDAALQHVEVALQQHDVGALARHVDGLVDRDADIGGVQRRRVVDAVAEEADGVAGCAAARGRCAPSAADRPRRRGRCARARCQSASSLSLAISSPVSMRLGSRPIASGQMRGDIAVVAGDHLDADAEARRGRGWSAAASGFRRIEEQQEALERHARLRRRGHTCARGATWRVASASRREARRRPSAVERLEPRRAARRQRHDRAVLPRPSCRSPSIWRRRPW